MTSILKKCLTEGGIFITVLLVAAVLYTWPAASYLVRGDTSAMLSDGTDPTTIPFSWEQLAKEIIKKPSVLLYGAILMPNLSSPEGLLGWEPGIEKFTVPIIAALVPSEHFTIVFVMFLMIANGLAFYALGRTWNWNKVISGSVGLAWAFSPFTRARAQVHPSLTGIFAFPLICMALIVLLNENISKKNRFILGSLLLIICGLSPHYYLIYIAILIPFWLTFYFASPIARKSWRTSIVMLAIITLPIVSYMGFGATHPSPPDVIKRVATVYPRTGESPTWPHPFLEMFSAEITDYFTGDVAVDNGFDINPIKNELNKSFRSTLQAKAAQRLPVGNLHEHSIGIRWIIWSTFFFGLIFFWRSRKQTYWAAEEKTRVYACLALGTFCFLASLPPDWGVIWGPSAWIHWLVPQIRTPNRIAILVHFSVLILSGIFISKWFQQKNNPTYEKKMSLLFCVLVISEFPPLLNQMSMTPVVPSRASQIQKKSGPCGMGFHFPHASGAFDMIVYYNFLQSLRGTDCLTLNPADNIERDFKMAQRFSYQNQQAMIRMMSNDSFFRKQLVQFADCNKLDFIVFDPRVPMDFSHGFCDEWHGTWIKPDMCRSTLPTVIDIPMGLPDQCLKDN